MEGEEGGGFNTFISPNNETKRAQSMINYQQPTNEHGNGRNPITSRKKNDGEIIIKLNKKKYR